MSFDNLSAEVAEEFAGLSALDRYGGGFIYANHAKSLEGLKQWNRDNAWRRVLPEYRARAVEVTREWRARMLADPTTAVEFRRKRAEWAKRWRRNNPEKARAMKRRRKRSHEERLRQDKSRHAAVLKRRAEYRRKLRASK